MAAIVELHNYKKFEDRFNISLSPIINENQKLQLEINLTREENRRLKLLQMPEDTQNLINNAINMLEGNEKLLNTPLAIQHHPPKDQKTFSLTKLESPQVSPRKATEMKDPVKI
jgi:hypothetical protein